MSWEKTSHIGREAQGMSKQRSKGGGGVRFQNLGKYKRVGKERIAVVPTLPLTLKNRMVAKENHQRVIITLDKL